MTAAGLLSLVHGDGATARAVPLAERFAAVRAATAALIAPLSPEDVVVQSMPDASPAKWHLAHTTWFFEEFVLGRDPAYRPLHANWRYLFNSYYQSVGPMHARPQRGLLSRPTLDEVLDWRARVDERMRPLLHDADADTAGLAELGLHHEQQHQELLLTDIKHLFSRNPLEPAYRDTPPPPRGAATPMRFVAGREGLAEIGYVGDGFAFDCETPRHRVLLQPHALADRPVTNAEFREFIRDGGYRTPTLWMAEGWTTVCERGWAHPLYWSDDLDSEFTLGGRRGIDPQAPVCHVSYFEADAFARWAGARLPTEAEWETAAATQHVEGNFADSGLLHPAFDVGAHPVRDALRDRGRAPGALLQETQPVAAEAVPAAGLRQLYGDVWEWTASPYVAYPGFRPLPGVLGEYNGKFMCGQWVLRGGSCATPAGHVRASYRNFFYPADRWQFMGLRLAR